MDLSALALSKQYTNKVAAGITAARVEDNTIILTLVDGSEARCNLPAPKDGTNGQDGVSVIDLSIDNDGSLLCHMSDGTVIDAGYVPMADVKLEDYYTKEEIDIKTNTLIKAYDWTYTTDKTLSDIAKLDSGLTFSSDTLSTIFTQMMNDWLDNNIASCLRVTLKTLYNSYREPFILYLDTEKTRKGNGNHLVGFTGYWDSAYMITLHLNGSWNPSTNAYTIGSSYFKVIEISNLKDYLSTTRTAAYTPTGDYHPATKKYVDDSITNIDIPEVDLTNYYTKEEVNETIENIDIPEVDLSNYYNKSEIGDITSLIGWKTNDTVISYFNNHPGIYDMELSYSLDDPTVEFTIPTNERERILQMIKKHKDKCFWLNIHTPSQSNGSHTLIPLHLSRFNSGETWKQIIPAFHFYNGTLRIRRVECETWSPTNSDSSDRPASLKMKFLSETTDNTIATKNDITTAISNISIPDLTNYYTKEEVNNITNNLGPKSHDGEGMIGWYGTAVAGDNLTEAYGVTPDMVRAVSAGDYISWPSRVQTGATENTICLYQMAYEVYNKDEGDYLEAIDIKIGKSPDVTYTYIIVGNNVYKETY